MFARLSIYENVDLDLADRVKQFMETLETDPFGELPGYRGSMTLVDRDNARLVGIGFYASAGQAHEADALLRRRATRPSPTRSPTRSGPRSTCDPTPSACTRSSTATEVGHVPLVLPHPGLPVPPRRRAARRVDRQGGRRRRTPPAAPRKPLCCAAPATSQHTIASRPQARGRSGSGSHHQPMIAKTAFAVLVMIFSPRHRRLQRRRRGRGRDDRVPGRRNDCDDRRRAP